MRKNLSDARKRATLTQEQLATKVKLTARQYGRLEAGTSDGSIKVWQRLKELLNKPIDYLLEQAPPTDQG